MPFPRGEKPNLTVVGDRLIDTLDTVAGVGFGILGPETVYSCVFDSLTFGAVTLTKIL